MNQAEIAISLFSDNAWANAESEIELLSSSGLEPTHKSRPSSYSVELHSQTGSAQIWLRNHAVTVLEQNRNGLVNEFPGEKPRSSKGDQYMKASGIEHAITIGRESLDAEMDELEKR